jgi:hypothetical protein
VGPVAAGVRFALLASAVVTLALGIFPSLVLNYAGQSSSLMAR